MSMDATPARSPVAFNRQNAADLITSILAASTEHSILCLDIDGRILLWNEGARRIYGYEPEEVVGRANLAVLFPPEDAAQGKPREIMEIVRLSGKWEGVSSRVRKNGQRFLARVVMTTRLDRDGVITGFLTISKDITAEIRFEELKAVQFYTRSLIEANIDALLTTNPLGIITDVNARFCEMTGYSQQELIGSAFKQYFTDPLRAEQAIHTVLAKERLNNYELIICSRDGSNMAVSLNASLLGKEDRDKPGVLISARDITEQKRNEAELHSALQKLEQQYRRENQYRLIERAHSESRAVLDAVSEAILLVSPDERLLAVNRCFTEFFGIPSDKVLDHPLNVLHAQLASLFVDPLQLQKLLARGTNDHRQQFTEIFVQHAPRSRELELYSTPVLNTTAEYIGRLYVLRDVTREREVDRMKSEFVSLVSHELRSPLTSIQGYIDLILADEEVGPLNDLQQEFLGVVRSNARRLVSLVNDLLDLSRIESGKMELHRESLDLNALIRELIPSFQPRLDAMHQTCTLHLPDQASMVHGDADRIIQILSNLLSNAHKYTPEAGHIDLAVSVVGTVARVEVTDSGVGLSKEEQAKLFTRFYRARNPLTASIGGTGLGLTIARSLVEMQGGEISVASEPGHGSTFCFTLPLVQQRALSAHQRRGDLGKRILVVDDEPDIRHLLQHTLQSAGYEVITASTGKEAFQLAQTGRPDLITLDMRLPDNSGLIVLEWLKNDPATAGIPVMLLTITDDDGQGRFLGATDYIYKPIKAEDLLRRITQRLQPGTMASA